MKGIKDLYSDSGWYTDTADHTPARTVGKFDGFLRDASFASTDPEDEQVVFNDGSHMTFDSAVNASIFGSTGRGKTQGAVIPQIYASADRRESMFILDCSGELHRTCAERVSRTHRIISINLRDPQKSDGFNLLGRIYDIWMEDSSRGDLEIESCCAALVPSQKNVNDRYWEDSARTFLSGVIKLLFISSKSRSDVTFDNLAGLIWSIQEEDSKLSRVLRTMNRVDAIKIRAVTSNANSTASCIKSYASSSISSIVSNRGILDVLSKDGLVWSELEQEPIAVFIENADETDAFNPVVGLMIKSAYSDLTRCAMAHPEGSLSRKVRFILDEFPTIASHVDVSNWLGQCRKRGIRFSLIMQSREMLTAAYDQVRAKVVIDNCDTMIVFGGLKDTDFLNDVVRYSSDDVSVSELRTLGDGEAYVLSKRFGAFKTTLVPAYTVKCWNKEVSTNNEEEKGSPQVEVTSKSMDVPMDLTGPGTGFDWDNIIIT